ncbi:Nramp family divalent metal transporter [Adhaeribacter aquaticus]|uniref:Nramp family divalent metal transporter n=1 Tax=Adhaeribacter aquaticus TaxID=299567 RepID=UPI000405CBD9|nr:Nramp family divalent metal transporter [Adhaeribacter aquaticus]
MPTPAVKVKVPVLETASVTTDPYILNLDKIQDPPKKLREALRYLGPGFVMSAAVVGSGELIATTALGARAGFVTFWLIMLSCLVKVALQLEWGKHAIYTGETTMTALNKLPGKKLGKVNWSIWLWLFIQVFKFLQMGGIVGGVAITLHMAVPAIPISVWAVFMTLVTSLLVYRGYYRPIEKLSLFMMLFFTVFTFASVYALQFTPFQISWPEVQQGLTFALPPEMVMVAVAAFGITGVGGDEIMYYNYWCLEKGYAAFTGPKQDSPEWEKRARGWIRIMYLDAFLAMVVYTLVTAAFYMLGAAVLHRQELVPEGYAVIKTLSEMYTQTLGSWAEVVFMIGAFMALYSTLFTATASFSRIFTDVFAQLGWLQFYDFPARKRMLAWLAWAFPASWCVLFLFIKLPVGMILIGGFMTSFLLLLVVFVALHFRYRRLPAALKPGTFYDLAFWLSAGTIWVMAIYGMVQVLKG